MKVHHGNRLTVLGCTVLLLGLVGLATLSPARAETSLASKAEHKARILEQIAAEPGAAPSPDTARITPGGAQAVDPRGAAPLDDPLTCLARTLYWEARGTSSRQMGAVASVVMNRLADARFPDTVCGVVLQGSEQGRCQFSWWCDGRGDDAGESDAYRNAKEVARRTLNGQARDITHGALYFHHRGISPRWASRFKRTLTSGDFVFYRPR